jgi:FtsZ-binding cell division protein ZapB
MAKGTISTARTKIADINTNGSNSITGATLNATLGAIQDTVDELKDSDITITNTGKTLSNSYNVANGIPKLSNNAKIAYGVIPYTSSATTTVGGIITAKDSSDTISTTSDGSSGYPARADHTHILPDTIHIDELFSKSYIGCSGNASLKNVTVNSGGKLNVNGKTTISSELEVTGDNTTTLGGSLVVAGTTTSTGAISTSAGLTVGSSANISGATTIDGTLTQNGSANFTNNVTLSKNVKPASNETVQLGESGNRFKGVYTTKVAGANYEIKDSGFKLNNGSYGASITGTDDNINIKTTTTDAGISIEGDYVYVGANLYLDKNLEPDSYDNTSSIGVSGNYFSYSYISQMNSYLLITDTIFGTSKYGSIAIYNNPSKYNGRAKIGYYYDTSLIHYTSYSKDGVLIKTSNIGDGDNCIDLDSASDIDMNCNGLYVYSNNFHIISNTENGYIKAEQNVYIEGTNGIVHIGGSSNYITVEESDLGYINLQTTYEPDSDNGGVITIYNSKYTGMYLRDYNIGIVNSKGTTTIGNTSSEPTYIKLENSSANITVHAYCDLNLEAEEELYLNGAGITANQTISISSDIRYKTVLQDLTLSLEDIANAPFFEFEYNEHPDTIEVGTSAQYWKEVCPNAVKSINNKYSLNYSGLALGAATSVAKEVVELKNEVVTLKEEVTTLKSENESLKAENEAIKSEIETLKNELSDIKQLLATLATK